ncbi:MAG: hypothetical protein ABMB14_34815 [Myxococcota bacterium]
MKPMSAAAVAALLAATGCQSENELSYTATLQAETNGLALSDNGLDAHGGMSQTTCTIDTNWGCPIDDADLPTADERVVDSYKGRTLGTSTFGLHTIVGNDYVPEDDQPLENVRTAGLYDLGQVVVHGGGDACWLRRDGGEPIAIPAEACDDGVRYTVDRKNGTLFASTHGGAVLRLDLSGPVALDDQGDLVAYDTSLGLLFTANTGGTELRALDVNGTERWSVTTRGPITDLAARGSRNEVLAMITRRDGLGGMERRDGATGELLGSSVLPTDDGTIVVSDNGQTVAVVLDDEVNFFDLTTDGDEPPVVDDTPPECITPSIESNNVNIGD